MTDFSPAYAPCSACSALVLFEGKRRKRDHGRAEALLLAWYGWQGLGHQMTAGDRR